MIINFLTPVIRSMEVSGQTVLTEFNRITPIGGDKYELFFVVDNNGEEQATSNGVATIGEAEVNELTALSFLGEGIPSGEANDL